MDYRSLTILSAKGISNILPISLGVSEAVENPDKTTKIITYNGIFDTGATGSVITKKVADQLKIFSIGLVNVHTASGFERSNTYLINMYFPNKLLFPGVRVTEGKVIGAFDILIGMDIIGAGDFVINNFNGHTSFSFRVPSVEFEDYTKKPLPIRQEIRQMKRYQSQRIKLIRSSKV